MARCLARHPELDAAASWPYQARCQRLPAVNQAKWRKEVTEAEQEHAKQQIVVDKLSGMRACTAALLLLLHSVDRQVDPRLCSRR